MNVPLIDSERLRQAGRNVPTPFAIDLDDHRRLIVRQTLRVLPGRRIAGLAELEGAPVFAKLFIDAAGAERYWQRERNGKSAMAARRIATPPVIAAGRLAAGGHYLTTGYLADARALAATDRPEHLAAAFEMLGRMHASGLVHDDAHLGNFLLDGAAVQVIDGDAVREVASDGELRQNLALLLAQLPANVEAAQRGRLLAAYRTGNPGLAIDDIRLSRQVEETRRRRLADYLRKCVRDCSRVQVERGTGTFVAMARDEADFLRPIIADPDRWLASGSPLKQGNTATLALIEHQGRKLVIKRYNIKGPAHALSRCWRPSRAWHSWLEGHRLRFLGIATPRPLALVERRFGPLRGRAWLIVEHCAGGSLATQPPSASHLQPVLDLFARLSAARISHGDMKATNLLWDGDRIGLIDLDAMRQHGSTAGYRRAWRKDRERFLRNWPTDPELTRTLSAALRDD
jgi:tRNA A-37 threonylcarbamoyl transferase component Bud32